MERLSSGTAVAAQRQLTVRKLLCPAGTVAPSRPKLEDDDAQSEAVPAADEPAFDWFRNWWPIALEADLDFERPNALQLLGKDIAVWRDTEGTWHAVHDLCPHRCLAGPVKSMFALLCCCTVVPTADCSGWELHAARRSSGLIAAKAVHSCTSAAFPAHQ